VGLWLSEKGNWPVRMKLSSSGLYGDGCELRADLLLDIRDVNSADIRVEPPSWQRCREELSPLNCTAPKMCRRIPSLRSHHAHVT